MSESQENPNIVNSKTSTPSIKGVDKGGGRISRIPQKQRGAEQPTSDATSRSTQQDFENAFTPKIRFSDISPTDEEVKDDKIIGIVSIPEGQYLYDQESNVLGSITKTSHARIIEETTDDNGNPIWKAIGTYSDNEKRSNNVLFFLKPGKDSVQYQSLYPAQKHK